MELEKQLEAILTIDERPGRFISFRSLENRRKDIIALIEQEKRKAKIEEIKLLDQTKTESGRAVTPQDMKAYVAKRLQELESESV